ncbi:hypothetical protein EI94DRAFT_1774697 [Lactarius quietus]|nr:hypothetical protein EI94DRAFT_1774697 [Lactarius quietus]
MTTGRPCQEDGTFLQELPPTLDKNDQQPHDWKPFEDRLAFDWAYYHYVALQLSASRITEGLNLWSATSFKHGSLTGAPWKMMPPHWMEQVYELNARDVLDVIQDQLATIAFKDQFDSTPYQEFNSNGDRIWSNLMSGHWAFKQADKLSQDRITHGAMFVPIIAGSDKTTVSAATGAHGNGVLPVAFLPIPKVSRSQRKRPEYHCFCRQLFHKCLEVVFKPLRKYMTSPTVMKCPDGLFHRTIFGLGPYIADYPEQVWVTGIVSCWCAKTLWDTFGIYEDVMLQPFTYNFPHANIHELISPDLLHQVIKGIFKDHLIAWVRVYLEHVHSKARSLEIMGDIDRWIGVVPQFPGLWQFPDGRDFLQWTGNNSKALMKVYLGALAGYLPSVIVHCISTFMDACYITCWNAISSLVLERFQECVAKYHELHDVFLTTGTLKTVSLPRQHALSHYHFSIQLFGSPNGLCSSITESKHRVSVKDNWYRSNHNNALPQMTKSLLWWETLAALHCYFTSLGMLKGTTAAYMAGVTDGEDSQEDLTPPDSGRSASGPDKDGIAVDEAGYPHNLQDLADFIQQPGLPFTLQQFLFLFDNPNSAIAPDTHSDLPEFYGHVHVHHLALATFFASSDLCGVGGIHQEQIRSTPSWYNNPCCDMVYVVLDDSLPGLEGMVISRVQLFFSFTYRRVNHCCTFVNWFVHEDDEPDLDTRMWVVSLEKQNGKPTTQVIDIKTIARATHLLPVFGSDLVPIDVQYHNSLDRYQSFFINKFADHHSHELLTDNY